jgi:hypothetical protein
MYPTIKEKVRCRSYSRSILLNHPLGKMDGLPLSDVQGFTLINLTRRSIGASFSS